MNILSPDEYPCASSIHLMAVEGLIQADDVRDYRRNTCLMSAFTWSYTIRGTEFWSPVHHSLLGVYNLEDYYQEVR